MKSEKPPQNWVQYSQIGIQMAVTIAAGVWLGVWLDERRAAKFPVFTIVLSLFAIFASIYNVIRQLPKT